jgi:chromosome segregation ATPase
MKLKKKIKYIIELLETSSDNINLLMKETTELKEIKSLIDRKNETIKNLNVIIEKERDLNTDYSKKIEALSTDKRYLDNQILILNEEIVNLKDELDRCDHCKNS